MNLNELKKLDFKKIINIVKTNYDKDAGLFTIVFFLIVFFGVKQFIMPALAQLSTNFANVNQKQQELQQYKEKEKYMAQPKTEQDINKLPVKIYQTPYPGMDTESASVELVEEIVRIIKQTGNGHINQVDFSTQEVKDSSGANSPDYGILRLNLTIEGSFESIKNMLNEIYLMNYLVVIKNITTTPVENSNFDTVTSVLTLDLYIKKS